MRNLTPTRQYTILLTVVAIFFGPVISVLGQTDPANTPDPAFATVTDDPQLPQVLLLGDSISIGYTPAVRELLAGQANVHRPAENCGSTMVGLERLTQWLGNKSWDVIHVNFGLHDLKYVNDAGDRVPPEEGHINVTEEQYATNLRQLFTQLRQTGARVIWASTTPVPEGASGRVADDSVRYNQVAARIAREVLGGDRAINDLHAFTMSRLSEIQKPHDVHFTNDGSRALAEQVATAIRQQLDLARVPTQIARGQVYHDQNGNRQLDAGEPTLPGIRVSNGDAIVTTDQQGRYELPVSEDAALFVIKPKGWRTPLNDMQLPQFYYLHKPAGSPTSKFPGVSPTGPLPASVDFALYPQDEPTQFKALLFGDPQPRNQKEVDFVTHDVVEELLGTDASFGVTLGDIAFDDLTVFESQAKAIALLGIPWYNVLGNHDMNYDAEHDQHSDETYERVFGPSYYSFDYGTVHFIVVDDVEWLVNEQGKKQYQGGLGRRQMNFIRRDLSLIPADQLVVLMMHIPLVDVRDRHDLFRLIEQRPFALSVSAHAHYHEHVFLTDKDGWHGPKPHHHVINVTVCGSWWSGMRDERGIPHATMADGAPNGYTMVTFDGHDYQMEFKAAARPADYQMSVHAPEVVTTDKLAETFVVANVFNGSVNSKVDLRIGNASGWIPMLQTRIEDPAYRKLYDDEAAIRALGDPKSLPLSDTMQMSGPIKSGHVWQAALPADLPVGTHRIRVRTIDMHGKEHHGSRILRVESPSEASLQLPAGEPQ